MSDEIQRDNSTRRTFLKNVAIGTAGFAAVSSLSCGTNQTGDETNGSNQVSHSQEPGTISSVGGYIKPSDLGSTLMHEHIAILTPGIKENWPHYFNEEEFLEIADKKLNELHSKGIESIVELTPPDLGRDIRLLKKVQDLTPLNIILCTGIYYDIPIFWRRRDADEMADALIKDIKEGIQGSEITASIIKLATDENGGGLDLQNEKSLRAGARAHRATGVPITTHTGPPNVGLEQQRVLREEGVDLSRVIIGHIGDTTDTDLQKRLMDEGSTIGMDRFGTYIEGATVTFEQRVNTVAKLCSEGYADRMILSHDHMCWIDWFSENDIPDGIDISQNLYTHISDDVLPALRERGVSEAQINQMMVKNPQRIFEKQGAY
jgi:phosphotriesterase-related protein